ncbi:MAG TPA: hypothetical protein PLZ42_04065, partial [Methanothrix sp.]|nr:hypothetical protein [Methanothrix sp.]
KVGLDAIFCYDFHNLERSSRSSMALSCNKALFLPALSRPGAEKDHITAAAPSEQKDENPSEHGEFKKRNRNR